MSRRRNTRRQILKAELNNLLWGLGTAVLVVLLFWFVVVPLVQKQIRELGDKLPGGKAVQTK
jgi:hypothetical protein